MRGGFRGDLWAVSVFVWKGVGLLLCTCNPLHIINMLKDIVQEKTKHHALSVDCGFMSYIYGYMYTH